MAEKSEFNVEVVRLGEIEKHPNADSLSITSVGGYPCVIKTGSFQSGDLAVYVPVDALVPTSRPEFAFLRKGTAERHRVRAARLRGTFSMGLLVAPDPSWVVGQNVQAELGIEKWIAPDELRLERHVARTAAMRALRGLRVDWMPVYGLEAFRRTPDAFIDGEHVVVTEKIHGCNARFAYRNGRLYVGSHRSFRGVTRHRFLEIVTRWKLHVMDWFGRRHRADLLRDAGDVWWECVERYGLKEKLAQHPNLVLYGEIYGEKVQDLRYDSPRGRKFRAFDVFDAGAGRYLSWDEMAGLVSSWGMATTPVLYRGPWTPTLLELAEGQSMLGDHVREGIVIKTTQSARRAAVKHVGEGYYLRNEAPVIARAA